jgi:hypothetical protein
MSPSFVQLRVCPPPDPARIVVPAPCSYPRSGQSLDPGRRTQNSLDSGSAMTAQVTSRDIRVVVPPDLLSVRRPAAVFSVRVHEGSNVNGLAQARVRECT